MEFRALGGQHLLGVQYNYIGSNDYHWTNYGAVYFGGQIKVTTSGERAIIYKKKEQHPFFSDRYVYAYYLLGSGQITDVKVADLTKGGFVDIEGWDSPLTNDDITELKLTTVMDWQNVNSPSKWVNAFFYDVNSDLTVVRNVETIYGSISDNILCGNMEIGTKLSNTVETIEYKTPFFGYPVSLNQINVDILNYPILNRMYTNEVDTYFPHNKFEAYSENCYNSTLLWKPNGNLTEYGQQFADVPILSAYDVYTYLLSSPYTERGAVVNVGVTSVNNTSVFSPTHNSITPTHEIDSTGNYGHGYRMGTTGKDDLIQNMAEEYMFVGIYVTEKYDQAKKYVDDGTVPDDAIKNDDINPTTDEDTTDNEDGKDNTKKDDQELHNPDNTALNSGSTTYYYMGASGLSAFIKWFWNDTGDIETILNNYISNMYGDLKECISGVYHFPCPLSAMCSETGNKQIVIGRYKSGLSSDYLKTPPINILLGSVNLSSDEWKLTNSFLDYDGYTNISLYLPYLGVVNLPTKTVQKTKLSVYYAVDVPSMQLKYTVKSNGLIVHEQVVQFGDEVPISLSSGLQGVTNTMTAVTGIASDVALLGTMGGGKKAIASTLVHTVANAHTTTDGITVQGNSSGVMGKWGSLRCALIVTKAISKRPSNYAKIKGNLICDTYKLSSLKGLTICENPRITFTSGNPTENEISEIYNLLEKGVIL